MRKGWRGGDLIQREREGGKGKIRPEYGSDVNMKLGDDETRGHKIDL